MSKVAAIIAVIAGVILSGQCAIWGAVLGGHDPKAGYPFPDFKGLVLFLVGFTLIPLGVVAFVAIFRRILSYRYNSVCLPIPAAILLLGPLVGLAMGYSVQARDNRKDKDEKEFYLKQREAYSSYAAQVTADPSIVLRERWYAKTTVVHRSADISARQMVFDHSFRPDNLSVPYTKDQLREISELAQDKRLYVVCHPECPPDLIESMWTSVFASGQEWIIPHMINNPVTPKHLLEAYRAERMKANRPVKGWIDREIEERIKEIEQDASSNH